MCCLPAVISVLIHFCCRFTVCFSQCGTLRYRYRSESAYKQPMSDKKWGVRSSFHSAKWAAIVVHCRSFTRSPCENRSWGKLSTFNLDCGHRPALHGFRDRRRRPVHVEGAQLLEGRQGRSHRRRGSTLVRVDRSCWGSGVGRARRQSQAVVEH